MRWPRLWPDNEQRVTIPVYGQDPLGQALVRGLDTLLALSARGANVMLATGGQRLAPPLSGTGISGAKSSYAFPQLQHIGGAGAALDAGKLRQDPLQGLAVRASDLPGGLSTVNGRLAAYFGEL
jgi:hypothetical protein